MHLQRSRDLIIPGPLACDVANLSCGTIVSSSVHPQMSKNAVTNSSRLDTNISRETVISVETYNW
jgi:hypothetical protein